MSISVGMPGWLHIQVNQHVAQNVDIRSTKMFFLALLRWTALVKNFLRAVHTHLSYEHFWLTHVKKLIVTLVGCGCNLYCKSQPWLLICLHQTKTSQDMLRIIWWCVKRSQVTWYLLHTACSKLWLLPVLYYGVLHYGKQTVRWRY